MRDAFDAVLDLSGELARAADAGARCTPEEAQAIAERMAAERALEGRERAALLEAARALTLPLVVDDDEAVESVNDNVAARTAVRRPRVPRWAIGLWVAAAAAALIVWLWPRDQAWTWRGTLRGGALHSGMHTTGPELPCRDTAEVVQRRLDRCLGGVSTQAPADGQVRVDVRLRGGDARLRFDRVGKGDRCEWRVEVAVRGSADERARVERCLAELAPRAGAP